MLDLIVYFFALIGFVGSCYYSYNSIKKLIVIYKKDKKVKRVRKILEPEKTLQIKEALERKKNVRT